MKLLRTLKRFEIRLCLKHVALFGSIDGTSFAETSIKALKIFTKYPLRQQLGR
jgi:hypothetical protein